MPSPVNFLIVHGAYGSPEGNWFRWLGGELKKYGPVSIPAFPTPARQNCETWLAVADEALQDIDPQDTILIGHSIGATLALRMAEKTRRAFKALFSVSPFARELGLADFDPLNATFYQPPLDWKAVMKGAEKIIVFAGDDDPYVPLVYSREIAEAVGAELITVKKGGHLNADSGYREFPALLERIRQCL